jgi:nucleoside 2-deoxyribosyltransferase
MKINMHTSHPSAFISSTFVDLHEDRAAVADALKSRGLNVNALDIRPASTQSSKHEILNGIKESDFVILIIGDRFGSILKSMTNSESQSITWWEYATALKMEKPVIAYFKNFDAHHTNSHDDRSEAIYPKKRKLFERFKTIVTKRHNPAFYTNPLELAKKVDESLISIYRSGVKKTCSTNAKLKTEVSELMSKISTLKSNIKTTEAPQSIYTKQGLAGLAGLGVALSGQPETQMESQPRSLIDILNKK